MKTIYDAMKRQLQSREDAFLVTALTGTRKGDRVIYEKSGATIYGEPFVGFSLGDAKVNELIVADHVEYFVQAIERDPEVLVVGAGHVSRAISDILLFVGCAVTVVDDRLDYLRPEFFDAAVHRVHCDMTCLEGSLVLSKYTGFIIVTRAHEYDTICLNQLRTQLPTYMGVMGSRKRIHYAFEQLRHEGWTEEELAQIYAPIGLDIGAQTPEEIALSIVSEYLAVTRNKRGGTLRSPAV